MRCSFQPDLDLANLYLDRCRTLLLSGRFGISRIAAIGIRAKLHIGPQDMGGITVQQLLGSIANESSGQDNLAARLDYYTSELAEEMGSPLFAETENRPLKSLERYLENHQHEALPKPYKSSLQFRHI